MATKLDNHRGELLVEMVRQWPKEEFEKFRHIMMLRVAEIKAVLKVNGMRSFVKEFQEAFDNAVAQEQTLVSCSKGCHFCCRQNVHVYKSEADVIAEYCREHEIEIPKSYFQEQMRYGWRELSKTEVGWCTFLKNGECSIYPVRPISCRNYFVVSDPKRCDVIAFPSEKGFTVSSKVFLHPLALAVAFGGIMEERKDKGGTLSEMMMPYSK